MHEHLLVCLFIFIENNSIGKIMMLQRVLTCAGALSISLFFIQPSMAQDYYKWVDASGSTHYTKNPPPKNAKNKGKVETYGWHNSTPTRVVEPQVNVPVINTPIAQPNNSAAPAAPAQAVNPSSQSSQPLPDQK